MKPNLIGSSLFFSFYIDNSDVPCKGVFSNGSDPLAYFSTELLPLLSSEIPKIAIAVRCLNSSAAKFYEQFLVPFLSLQNITCANDVEVIVNRDVEISQFSFAIPFDPIFKWLEPNALMKRKKFIIFIYSTESKIPVSILTELEALETQIKSVRFLNIVLINYFWKFSYFKKFLSSKRAQDFIFYLVINASAATNYADFPKRQQILKNNGTKEELCIKLRCRSNKKIRYKIARNSVNKK